ncbi:hypothetical protein BS47DRAFT_1364322 [Hydnum rufescens UP504]|uniref:CxC1-like cysteine cluster associated with KDZ transposases domain-containing protein n=1 Tax=Hydnum rufescens UP504 TaxID=1448309 RepID=A0A9P6DQ40_9AGAM|nr:hypothetical protein BS47DRAFT_1364322 [Hydnum rufescens UP504]
MLEFVAELFLHIAPNERGWAAMLVKYLKARRYHFVTADSFRCRFANALAHYQQLVRLVDAEVEKLVDRSQALSGEDCVAPQLDETTPVNGREYSNAQNTATFPSDHNVPSTYLQTRCPLCFGSNSSENGDLKVDAIVCLDANFQLKCQRDLDQHAGHQGETGTQDPFVVSPRTIELSQRDLELWEAKILDLRPKKSSAQAGQKRKANETMESEAHAVEDEDKVEDDLKMLNSTYSACGESFIAADGDCVKALTQYFSDTGVLAMLCHHNIPLVIASMWTAGEKQFYTCALLDFLFKHLPHCWRIGVLYDIGCQMDQSLKKWNFMPDWSPRLEWGISIFHAYGHQWTCQLWYHPRKRTIWGLSDGEGLECIDEEKWGDFGKWLQVRVDRAQSRLDEAKEKLAKSTFSIEYLLHQFKDQCAYHSKPIMRQSKTQGAHAIEHILSLQSTLEAQQENLQELISEGNDVIPEDSAGEAVLVKWQERVHSTKLAISRLQSNIKKRMEGLKLGDRVAAWKLEQLKKDRWITMQLNLRILREQLVRKLHARKFKLATLDRAHSTWILDQKTKVHVEKAVHHRSSGIDAMMKKYNAKIKEMAEYHQTSRTISKSAYIPPLLLKEGLYKMDVDQDIWEDARADIGDFPDGVLPQWLVDALVKKGIFMAQEVVNCEQELERCKVESSNLRTWFYMEYRVVKRLVKEVDDEVSFFALHRLHQLYEWLELWRVNMIHVPTLSTAPSWDEFLPPLTLEHHASRIRVHVPNVDGDDDDAVSSDDDQDGEVEEDIETEDLGFITLIDNVIGDFQ